MCKRANEYQKWAINLLVNILNDTNLNSKQHLSDHGYKYSLKNGVVCHYASMYWNGEEYINMWQTNFNSKRYKGAEKPLLMSKRAYEIITKIKDVNDETQFRDKENRNKPLLHWEHITPNGYVYKKLLLLSKEKILKKDVENCFRHHKIVLLSKEESSKLDGKGESFTEDDKKTLQIWQHKLNKDFKEDIESLSDEKGFLKCKNYGSGLARIAHLWNEGVRFKKFEGENIVDYDIEKIFEYLEDKDFTYTKEV